VKSEKLHRLVNGELLMVNKRSIRAVVGIMNFIWDVCRNFLASHAHDVPSIDESILAL